VVAGGHGQGVGATIGTVAWPSSAPAFTDESSVAEALANSNAAERQKRSPEDAASEELAVGAFACDDGGWRDVI
jgi:hypothetical protein